MIIALYCLAMLGSSLEASTIKNFSQTPLTSLELSVPDLFNRIQKMWMTPQIKALQPQKRLLPLAYVINSLKLKHKEMINILQTQARVRANIIASKLPALSSESLFVYLECLPELKRSHLPRDHQIFGKSIFLRTPPLGTQQQFFHIENKAPACYQPVFQIWSASRFAPTNEKILFLPSEVIMIFLDAVRMLILEQDETTRQWYRRVLQNIWLAYFQAINKHESRPCADSLLPPAEGVSTRRGLDSIINTLCAANIRYTDAPPRDDEPLRPRTPSHLSLNALLDPVNFFSLDLMNRLKETAHLLALLISLETSKDVKSHTLWPEISDIAVIRDHIWKNPEIILKTFQEKMSQLEEEISSTLPEELKIYYETLQQTAPEQLLKTIKKDKAIYEDLQKFCFKAAAPA